jgi:negative elongation factor C/D
VVHLLAENYRGYAEMANLMSSWLVASGLDADEVSEIVKEKLKAVLMEKFSPSQADSIFAEMQSAPHWLDVMIEHPEWRALIYRVPLPHSPFAALACSLASALCTRV